MSGANSFKFVLLPPQSDTTRDWAKRLAENVPEARVILAEDADTAAGKIVDAEDSGRLGQPRAQQETDPLGRPSRRLRQLGTWSDSDLRRMGEALLCALSSTC
jgi:hypothetical protein